MLINPPIQSETFFSQDLSKEKRDADQQQQQNPFSPQSLGVWAEDNWTQT